MISIFRVRTIKIILLLNSHIGNISIQSKSNIIVQMISCIQQLSQLLYQPSGSVLRHSSSLLSSHFQNNRNVTPTCQGNVCPKLKSASPDIYPTSKITSQHYRQTMMNGPNNDPDKCCANVGTVCQGVQSDSILRPRKKDDYSVSTIVSPSMSFRSWGKLSSELMSLLTKNINK